MIRTFSGRHIYRVLFWAYPKSGFDVMKKNIVVGMFKQFIDQLAKDDPEINEKLSSFFKEHEDKATFIEIIESDEEIKDPMIEVLPILQEKYPGAEIAAVIPFSPSQM